MDSLIKKLLIVLSFALLSPTSNALAQVLVESPLGNCISEDAATIEGLYLHQRVGVLFNHPAPLYTSAGRSEDDGGSYIYSVLGYENYTINFVRDHIDLLATSSPNISWAGGIQIGDTMGDVSSAVGRLPSKPQESHFSIDGYESRGDESFVYQLCGLGDFALLNFEQDVLIRIVLVAGRP